jgi:hypothetical protein
VLSQRAADQITHKCEGHISGASRRMPMLEIESINSFYGDSHVLFDVSLRVPGQQR